jgi:glutathione S-transferase
MGMVDALLTHWLRWLGGTPCFRVYGKARPEVDWRVIDVYATHRRDFGIRVVRTADPLQRYPRLGLAPKSEPQRLWLHQQQLTISDWLVEVHDTHHPIGSGLYYEDQKPESRRRAEDFRKSRLPKYLGYFERLERGRTITYVELSLFQMVEGLRYALPKTMRRIERKYPKLLALHDRVAARPRLAAYLASERRIAFNQQGIFRHYQELDA